MFKGDLLLDNGDIFVIPTNKDNRLEPKKIPKNLDLRTLHEEYLLDGDVLLKNKFAPVTEVRFVEGILVH